MPLIMNTLANTVAKNLPKVVSPRTHSVLDYAMASAFFIAGGLFWRRNRRAAVASFVNGAVVTGLALATDYPGGIRQGISYRTHGRIESALPALTAGLPRLMGFAGKKEARFFGGMAIAGAALAGISEFRDTEAGGRLVPMPVAR